MTEWKGRTLGLLLSGRPDGAGFAHGVGLARAAVERGMVVHVYCVDAGVLGVSDARIQGLREAGVRLHACALSARRFGVEIRGQASPAGLGLASAMLSHVDRVLSFS